MSKGNSNKNLNQVNNVQNERRWVLFKMNFKRGDNQQPRTIGEVFVVVVWNLIIIQYEKKSTANEPNNKRFQLYEN